MARIDYFAIEKKLGDILSSDSTLQGVKVIVEEDVEFEDGPYVGIYLERRDATASQSLSSGTKIRYDLKLSIWCWSYSLDSVADAINSRDDLVGKVELVLLNNRTIGDKVTTSWLEGGEMPSARLEGEEVDGYISGGEIILTAQVSASI